MNDFIHTQDNFDGLKMPGSDERLKEREDQERRADEHREKRRKERETETETQRVQRCADFKAQMQEIFLEVNDDLDYSDFTFGMLWGRLKEEIAIQRFMKAIEKRESKPFGYKKM